MDMTRERISLIFELTVIFLSFHKGFNLVSTAVVCAILANISGLEPSSVIIDPIYLKLVTVSNLCPLTLTSVLKPCVLFVISLFFSMFSIWAVPGPSSRCFMFAKCASRHQLIIRCKFEEP